MCNTMNRKLNALLATVLMSIMMISCASNAGPLGGDTRFTRSESSLGLNSQEVVQGIGSPGNKVEKGCGVPFQDENKTDLQLFGDLWIYEAEGEDSGMQLILCMLEDFVVGESVKYFNKVGSRITMGNNETLDQMLVKKALDGSLTLMSKKERQNAYKVPEVEL